MKWIKEMDYDYDIKGSEFGKFVKDIPTLTDDAIDSN